VFRKKIMLLLLKTKKAYLTVTFFLKFFVKNIATTKQQENAKNYQFN